VDDAVPAGSSGGEVMGLMKLLRMHGKKKKRARDVKCFSTTPSAKEIYFMEKCGKKVTHMVCVVGKKKIGFVCTYHLQRVKEICVLENVALHVEKYDGEEMFCQLPGGGAGEHSQEPK
jgi:hypothetical protein